MSGTAAIRVLPALALALCLAPARPALAERTPQVDALYKQGKEALDAGEHLVAIGLFERSLGLVRGDEPETWTMLLALAATYDQMGRERDALVLFQHLVTRILPSIAPQADLWMRLREHSAAQAARLEVAVLRGHGGVEVGSVPASARILLDGEPVAVGVWAARTPIRIYCTPGSHQLELALEGHGTARIAVEVRVGALAAVEGRLQPHRPEPAPAPRSTPTRPETAVQADLPVLTAAPHRRPGTPPTLGWALVASGLAVAGVGVPFSVRMADNARDIRRLDTHLEPDEGLRRYGALADEYRLNAALQGVFYGAGGIAAIVGAVLLATHDGPDDDAGGSGPPSLGVQPVPGGGVVGAWGRF